MHLVEANPCWLGPAGLLLRPRGRGADYGYPMEQLSLERKRLNAFTRFECLSAKRSISNPGGVQSR